jgi:nitrate/nitrite-specific signal transduction histidine kinase|tara:strand:+ start:868 stop:1995 length:1128 start_codon:yes stop_codon:yes gene_type:complete
VGVTDSTTGRNVVSDDAGLSAASGRAAQRPGYALRQRFAWLSALTLLLAVIAAVLALMLSLKPSVSAELAPALAVVTGALLISTSGLLWGIRRWLLQPLLRLRYWASEIRQGDFSARLLMPEAEAISGLADDINRLAEWLESLAHERERELQVQRERLEERTQLANELHDSLAQTLASLKFQVRVLDDTLRQDSEPAIWQEMERIESSLDEANVELRELIAHFRAPVSKHGLMSGIRRLLSRFRKETGTEAVLQNQAQDVELAPEEEIQVLRIVQESLANVRKHSRANMVRVLLSRDSTNRFRLVIEDDGTGMALQAGDHDSEHHFGLAIMRERAAAVGAALSIESEPGEGTRVVMELDTGKAAADESVTREKVR